jgi:type II secretory ATPase GspE/PulE/Tfp pilus assembly ATPase PilB-like protein
MGAMNLADPVQDVRRQVLDRLATRVDLGDSAMARAHQLATATGIPTEHALNRLGIVSDELLAETYAEILDLPLWRPTAEDRFEDDTGSLSGEYLRRHGLLPVRRVEDIVEVAAQDPLATEGLKGLAFALGLEVRPLAARVSDLREALDSRFPVVREAPEASMNDRAFRAEIDRVEDEGLSSDAVAIVARTVATAMRRRASDIHFEPRRHDLSIRLRVDGQLVSHQSIDRAHADAVMTRIKVLANLDLGERRLPQDGRASVLFEGRNIELRVSILPSVHGESAVLRILDRNEMAARLETLGLNAGTTALLDRAVRSASGVFLVSGPTGSGKTTTLYAMLNRLKASKQKILSVEDPVEYRFDHVVQVQVAAQIGLTFAAALRTFLRQDPDILLIGEIRDAETAEIAFQAAMTGHLVLASVHANDALRVVNRMRDLDVPGYQIAASLLGASAQRLVRKLCLACREEAPMSELEARWSRERGLALSRTWTARGCLACDQEGFVGRTALSEAYTLTAELADAVGRDLPAADIRALALQAGYRDMAHDAAPRIEAGEIALADVIRALGV